MFQWTTNYTTFHPPVNFTFCGFNDRSPRPLGRLRWSCDDNRV